MSKQTKRAEGRVSEGAVAIALLSAVVLCDTTIHGVPLKAGSIVRTDEATAKAHAHELDVGEAAVAAKQEEFPGIDPIDALPAVDEIPDEESIGEQGEA